MKNYEAMGFRVEELRKERGMTKKELAEKTGFSYSTVLRITKGKSSDILTSRLFIICRVLGVTLKGFFASPLFDEKNVEPHKKQGKKHCG